MRHIVKPISPPTILLSDAVKNSLIEIIKKRKCKDIVQSNLYQGLDESGEKLVVKALLTLYHNKCAYCERYIGQTSIEIEHYRPQWFYYWLCYEWTNLLPSCHYCNTFRFGKGKRFSVKAKKKLMPSNTADYKANSQYLLDEKPDLLHPEIDEPEMFFKFDANGKILGHDREGRGEATIKICNLRSFELNKNRQQICVDSLCHTLEIILAAYDEKISDTQTVAFQLRKAFEILEKEQNIEYRFSLMTKYVFDNFETPDCPHLFLSLHVL